ncbi:hypothetical protein OBV_42250 [Oscillibacter valericigenes Sjm18-20]|nr:hypothetical protein OBV_42250 [Oscillibacter valericigenes Sjm18-20]
MERSHVSSICLLPSVRLFSGENSHKSAPVYSLPKKESRIKLNLPRKVRQIFCQTVKRACCL